MPGVLSSTVPSNTDLQALQELLQASSSSSTPELQYQILQMLKSNPSLMAALIRHRQQMSPRSGGDGLLGPGQPQQEQQQQER